MAKKIGYVPQNIYLSDDTIKNNIAYGYETENINQKEIFEILKKYNLRILFQVYQMASIQKLENSETVYQEVKNKE